MATPTKRRPPWWKRIHGCILYPIVILVLASCILLHPCMSEFRFRDGDRPISANNIANIAAAFRNYHDAYGHLPPAVITNKDGKPLYSWRVALLPFLEQN